jgi:hypothetical protein
MATKGELEGLADGGPRYAETQFGRMIVEPWNAVSATLFLFLVGFWTVRLWGRYRRFSFLTSCLPILAAGGLGGTLYHAFRVTPVFFWMDIVPIYFLGVAASLFFCVRLRMSGRQVVLLLFIYVLLQGTLFPIMNRVSPANPHVAINVSYGLLAGFLLLPLALLLRRTRFRDGIWIGLGMALFCAALWFRAVDQAGSPLLPMGTHWLWHTFGAAAVAALTEYVYRLEGYVGHPTTSD